MKKKQKKEVEDNASDTSESSESEYEAEQVTIKTRLTDIQVVCESSQQQGYVAMLVDLQMSRETMMHKILASRKMKSNLYSKNPMTVSKSWEM